MESNREMVDYLVEKDRIETERVEEAFRSVDRADFVPEDYRSSAYADRPLRIGEAATISAPHMVAINTELLEPEKGDKVLEIGSGSGYQLAVLAEIVDKAVGVEINEDLVEKSRDRLEDYENTRVVHGNGLDAVEGNFDRMLYSCGVESVEEAFEHLEDDGIIVAPVRDDRGQVLKKFKDGEVEKHGRVRFVEKK